MGGCTLDGPNGVAIESVGQMFGRFCGELSMRFPQWQERLQLAPDQLDLLEREVHADFKRGADQIVAGLIAVVLLSAELATASEQTRKTFGRPLSRGRNRSVRVKLLGGFTMWITSLYCEPKRSWLGAKKETVSGVYIELAQFGFGKGITPGLQSHVARQAALCPSLMFAKEELEREGLKLEVKTVRRIANQCGEGLLRLRKHQLLQWRAGKLPAGKALRGQRVSVQIDGGRTKIRRKLRELAKQKEAVDENGLVTADAPARSKPRSQRSFDSEWREPKLVTIFVHDENGRMEKLTQATMDGTFTGPDAITELIAMHLHRLGAAAAFSITFVSDGAPWIWDRVGRMISLAKVPATVKVYEVLDNCHASHHISMALAALGLSTSERLGLYRQHRGLMRNGQWRRVVEELSELGLAQPENTAIQTEINYLKKHGEAGRLSYTYFVGLGLPIGSGAIESSIRRVINLRLKNNGTFWLESNAECMLQLRANVISGRWDERLGEMRSMNRHHHEADWTWIPAPMSCKAEAAGPTPI